MKKIHEVILEFNDKGFTQKNIRDIVEIIVNTKNEDFDKFIDYVYFGEVRNKIKPISIKEVVEFKNTKFNFMEDGIVEFDFISNSSSLETLFMQIKKLPTSWNKEIALSLGYSSNDMAWRQFSGIKGILRFCDVFSREMKIDFTKKA